MPRTKLPASPWMPAQQHEGQRVALGTCRGSSATSSSQPWMCLHGEGGTRGGWHPLQAAQEVCRRQEAVLGKALLRFIENLTHASTQTSSSGAARTRGTIGQKFCKFCTQRSPDRDTLRAATPPGKPDTLSGPPPPKTGASLAARITADRGRRAAVPKHHISVMMNWKVLAELATRISLVATSPQQGACRHRTCQVDSLAL